MKNTLIILGHPNYLNSITNKTIVERINEKIISNDLVATIKIRNLIELYPDYKIDILVEQESLVWADNIVLQFPFYWYSVPAILKLWMDEVLEYGFAYGKTGDKLKDKNLLLSLSTGGPQDAYSATGRNNFEMLELLKPIIQTSNLMGTNFIEPIISHSMVNIPTINSDRNQIKEKAYQHAEKLFEKITFL